MNEKEFLELLLREQGELTDTQFAKKIGISQSYLSEVKTGRKDPGPAVLAYFRLERVITYKPKSKAKRATQAL